MNRTKPSIKKSGSFSKLDKKRENPINEEIVIAHLQELGYSASALDPQALSEFVIELQDLWEKDGLKEFPLSAQDIESEFESNGNNSTTTIQSSGNQKITKHLYNASAEGSSFLKAGFDVASEQYDWKRNVMQVPQKVVTIKSAPGHDLDDYYDFEEYEEYYKEKSLQDDIPAMIDNLNLNMDRFKEKALEQQKEREVKGGKSVSPPSENYSYYDDYSSSFESSSKRDHFQDISLISRPTTSSSTKSKTAYTNISTATTGFIKVPQPVKARKNDPVSRYHQHQAQWNKDQFLKRLNTTKSNNQFVGRWGGMSTAAHEQPVKIRHNLNSKRSDYVIPSMKKRTDVIWSTREKMAQRDFDF